MLQKNPTKSLPFLLLDFLFQYNIGPPSESISTTAVFNYERQTEKLKAAQHKKVLDLASFFFRLVDWFILIVRSCEFESLTEFLRIRTCFKFQAKKGSHVASNRIEAKIGMDRQQFWRIVLDTKSFNSYISKRYWMWRDVNCQILEILGFDRRFFTICVVKTFILLMNDSGHVHLKLFLCYKRFSIFFCFFFSRMLLLK